MTNLEDQTRETIDRWASSIDVDIPEPRLASSYVRPALARTRAPRYRLVAAAAAVLLIVAGVALVRSNDHIKSVNPSLENPPATAPPGTIDGMSSVSPLADFMTKGASGGRSYEFALQHRIGACMTDLGWQYPLADHNPESGETTDPSELLQFRQTYGYGLLNGYIGDPTFTNQHAGMLQAFSPTERDRFYSDLGQSAYDEGGTPVRDASGCTGEAERELHDHFPINNPDLLSAISFEGERVTEDPAYVAAVEQWRSCMGQAGYEYDAEDGGRRAVSEAYSSGAPTDEQRAQERAIGTADATCASQTLWPARAQLENAIVDRLITDYGVEATCGEDC